MPFELPEATIIAGQIDHTLRGKQIITADLHLADDLIQQGFINVSPQQFHNSLKGKKFEYATARGKWISIKFTGGIFLLISLETHGDIRFLTPEEPLPTKFTIHFQLSDGSSLIIRIIGWGHAHLISEKEFASHSPIANMGINPLDERNFTFQTFADILQSHPKKLIKALLLDQTLIAGLGNQYLQDILYRARIHPARTASSLTEDEQKSLYLSILDTIQRALDAGGRANETDLFGKPGGYHPMMGKHALGKPCYQCGTTIERIKIARSYTYYCPTCQKLPSTEPTSPNTA